MDDIADALSGISGGGDPESQAEALMQAVDRAAQAAWTLAEPKATSGWSRRPSASFGEIIGANIKALRDEADWTQERLAEAMAHQGFPWKRITCAEVEASSRRVSLEEVLTLAALFAEPAITFLLPDDTIALDLPERDVLPDAVIELLLGLGGQVGRGGVAWRAPARALRRDKEKSVERPAVSLWRQRLT
jgi:hypothetical protein